MMSPAERDSALSRVSGSLRKVSMASSQSLGSSKRRLWSVMSWLLEAVVEQVECLGVGSLVGQGEGVEVDGVLEVDDEIASCALGAADEVVDHGTVL